ncbi:hypothetical protein [Lactobacillus helveticus]|uniref:Atpase n=2 Tax=Lactobacillus helveticus TaxID=1587 RepID=A0AAN4ZXD6_LACHE|nr:hypothetical protein [Lactobacillus helveticus]AHI12547.1 ATP-binding protein [Lactobacillus helveticus H9]EEW67252.1 hypothetical protein HMPREF0518_1774 [Lactobacillus helveticus DSM 20075 = CGMCC 1.1877]EGF35803.1 atpase [Lactobacillus helveticus MTCC 5463]CDI60732.1 Atpase [Lactobacillus helveticus CIRM-BIA 104]CDI62344.1 Atpase [Lactobacillus helveticus CIRM-BIA 103]CDI65146.1 Atpase [Lactobacillus helveticus CIRM-BIA 101]
MINEFLKDKKAIYFTAIEENKEDNLRRFSAAINHFMDPDIISESSFSSFEAAFRQIAELAKKRASNFSH